MSLSPSVHTSIDYKLDAGAAGGGEGESGGGEGGGYAPSTCPHLPLGTSLSCLAVRLTHSLLSHA